MVTVSENTARFRFFRPGAKSVEVVGDFNNWHLGQIRMRPEGHGYWLVDLVMPPGCYQFRYRADGQWFTDYAAYGIVQGPLGVNSVVRIAARPVAATAQDCKSDPLNFVADNLAQGKIRIVAPRKARAVARTARLVPNALERSASLYRQEDLGSRTVLKYAPRPAVALAQDRTFQPTETDNAHAVRSPAAAKPKELKKKIRVLIADDHAFLRRGIAQRLAMEPDIEVVGEASDGLTAVELTRRFSPDALTMDISMPGMNGIEATRIIRAEFPRTRVIGLSMLEGSEATEMRQAGAVHCLTKSGPSQLVIDAIRGRLSSTA